MNVILYCQEKLSEVIMSANDVQAYINLIKAYGYMDGEGHEYTFESAQVEPEGVCIYLIEKE